MLPTLRAPVRHLLPLLLVLLCSTAAPATLPKVECEAGPAQTAVHAHQRYPDHGVTLPLDGAPPTCPVGVGGEGHLEFAFGGAILLADASKADMCWGRAADHAPRTLIQVRDAAQPPGGAAFTVYVDVVQPDPVPDEMACGDFEYDLAIGCVGSCTPPFPPGLDGAYHVVVHGTEGTVRN